MKSAAFGKAMLSNGGKAALACTNEVCGNWLELESMAIDGDIGLWSHSKRRINLDNIKLQYNIFTNFTPR
jgi:hypothetical protein